MRDCKSIPRKDRSAARNASLDIEHDATGPGIDGMWVGGERLCDRKLDFADVVLRDRRAFDGAELTRIDRAADRDDGIACLRRADADDERCTGTHRLLVQPE